jgi:hypothetical protein
LLEHLKAFGFAGGSFLATQSLPWQSVALVLIIAAAVTPSVTRIASWKKFSKTALAGKLAQSNTGWVTANLGSATLNPIGTKRRSGFSRNQLQLLTKPATNLTAESIQ